MESKAQVLGNSATVVLVLLVSVVHGGLSHVATKFLDIFAGFGFDSDNPLPLLTSLMLSGAVVFWLVPVLVLLLVVFNRLAAAAVTRSAVIVSSVLLTVGSLALFIIAMYLPVLRLGAIVQ